MTDRVETTLIHGKPVRYRIRRSKRARRLNLHISARAGLEVVLPWRWALRDVESALREHAAWIDRHVDRHGVRHGPQTREFVDGMTLSLLGEAHVLQLRPLPAGRVRMRVTVGEHVVETDVPEAPAGAQLSVFDPPPADGRSTVRTITAELPAADLLDPRPALRRWLRRTARTRLEGRVAHFAEMHGFDPRRVIVGERRSRWGSCSSSGTLSFCDRLIMAPPRVIDAVVCHELCHLRHMNHGRGFKALIARVCPDHDKHMDWLREHHDELEF